MYIPAPLILHSPEAGKPAAIVRDHTETWRGTLSLLIGRKLGNTAMGDGQVPSPANRHHSQAKADQASAYGGNNKRQMQHAAADHDGRAGKRGHSVKIRAQHGRNFSEKH